MKAESQRNKSVSVPVYNGAYKIPSFTQQRKWGEAALRKAALGSGRPVKRLAQNDRRIRVCLQVLAYLLGKVSLADSRNEAVKNPHALFRRVATLLRERARRIKAGERTRKRGRPPKNRNRTTGDEIYLRINVQNAVTTVEKQIAAAPPSKRLDGQRLMREALRNWAEDVVDRDKEWKDRTKTQKLREARRRENEAFDFALELQGESLLEIRILRLLGADHVPSAEKIIGERKIGIL